MKKAFVLLWMVSVFSPLQGQSYHPLVETGKIWSTRYAIEQTWIYSDFKKFEGETTINGNIYQKVWDTQDTSLANWDLRGFIRENAQHQVFYLSSFANQEKLIYDFSLQPGDSVKLWDEPFWFRLDSITNSTLLTGEIRPQFYLSMTGTNFTDRWIEGIGSLWGLLESTSSSWVGGTSDLLCFTENDTLKYHNPAFSGCYVITGIRDREVVQPFRIILSPGSEKLNIITTGSGYNNLSIDLVDLYGRIILTSPVINDNTEINLAGLTLRRGVCLARIRSGINPVFTSKLIIAPE
jgi:hypothetical protein